jgi:hypothetical protein
MNTQHHVVEISVDWNHPDLELRTMSALAEVMDKAANEGLSPAAMERVAAYVAERYQLVWLPSISVQEE